MRKITYIIIFVFTFTALGWCSSSNLSYPEKLNLGPVRAVEQRLDLEAPIDWEKRFQDVERVVEFADGTRIFVTNKAWHRMAEVMEDTFFTVERDNWYYTHCYREDENTFKVIFTRPDSSVSVEIVFNQETLEAKVKVFDGEEERVSDDREKIKVERDEEGHIKIHRTVAYSSENDLPESISETIIDPEQIDEQGHVEVLSSKQTRYLQSENTALGALRETPWGKKDYLLEDIISHKTKRPLFISISGYKLARFTFEQTLLILNRLNRFFYYGEEPNFQFYLEWAEEGYPVCRFKSDDLEGTFPAFLLMAPLGQVISDEEVEKLFGKDVGRENITDRQIIDKLKSRETQQISLLRPGYWDMIRSDVADIPEIVNLRSRLDRDYTDCQPLFFHVHPEEAALDTNIRTILSFFHGLTPEFIERYDIEESDLELLLDNREEVATFPAEKDIAAAYATGMKVIGLGMQPFSHRGQQREGSRIIFFPVSPIWAMYAQAALRIQQLEMRTPEIFETEKGPILIEAVRVAMLKSLIFKMKNCHEARPFGIDEKAELVNRGRYYTNLEKARLRYVRESVKHIAMVDCTKPEGAEYNPEHFKVLVEKSPEYAPIGAIVETEREAAELQNQGKYAVSLEGKTFEEAVRFLKKFMGRKGDEFKVYTMREGLKDIEIDGEIVKIEPLPNQPGMEEELVSSLKEMLNSAGISPQKEEPFIKALRAIARAV